MEDNGDGEDLTPFWLQTTADLRSGERLRRGASSFFFSSGLVVFLLLVAAVFFLIFVIPSTLSFTAQIFRPNSVKKSWNSLNIVLVLVAVVFGFLSRNRNEERYSYHKFQATPRKENESQKSDPSTPNKWYNYPSSEGQTSNLSSSSVQWYQHSDVLTKLEFKNSVLKRNSSSYPDLVDFPPVDWSSYGDYHQRRFYDDNYVDPGRVSGTSQLHHRRHRSLEEVDSFRAPLQTKTVIVDTLQRKFEKAANSPPLPISAQSTASRVASPLRFEGSDTNEDINEIVPRRKEKSRRRVKQDPEFINSIAATTPPPPPPPAPPPHPPTQQQKRNTEEKKRSGATGSATKDFLSSLYHKNKKKQRQKSVDNLDSLLGEAQAPLTFQLPPPSPPPPPPPPPVFKNLFSIKKQKRTRTIKVTLNPPPQPEPDPNPQVAPLTSHKPPKPIQWNSFEKSDENSNSGGESPLSRIPRPPPPPPPAFFKSPAWKFVVQGDYVRVNSNTSSRSGSPDPDEVDSDVTPSATDGGDITPFHPSPLFCPSPDVNTKAESFITNFRAKLKLEKIHSMKKRDLGPSSLGPKPGPSEI